MASRIKRSIVLDGHRTSVSLEDPFWDALKDIAKWKRNTVAELISSINLDRKHANLSSALRLFVLNYYQTPAALLNGTSSADHATRTEPLQSGIAS
jgi:predicted DNA-binding ribbon-helix-helix protein